MVLVYNKWDVEHHLYGSNTIPSSFRITFWKKWLAKCSDLVTAKKNVVFKMDLRESHEKLVAFKLLIRTNL